MSLQVSKYTTEGNNVIRGDVLIARLRDRADALGVAAAMNIEFDRCNSAVVGSVGAAERGAQCEWSGMKAADMSRADLLSFIDMLDQAYSRVTQMLRDKSHDCNC